VREAFEKSIDREALNQVVYEGRYVPSNQTEAPGSRYYAAAHPVPPRDVAGARALLKAAGVERPKLSLIVPAEPVGSQVGQVIQAMAGEAGFEVSLTQMDGATMVASARSGDYEAAMGIWSGRPDPDGNISIWMTCKGFLNWGDYCNPALDQALSRAAQVVEPAERARLYAQAADIWLADRPHMVLYHFTWLWGVRSAVTGLVPRPDGLLRWEGVRVAP
jgi:peptide/nickel transport system substrate-binding protein